MGRHAGNVDLGGLDLPAEFAAQNVHGNGLADIRRGGQHSGCAQQCCHMFGHGIGTAHMARQNGNHKLSRIIDHQHAGVFVLAFQMRGNQPYHCAERDEKNYLVKLSKQRSDFVAERATVGAHRVG